MNPYKIAAHKIPRHESAAKVTGKALYTEDLSLPKMVYGMIIRSPHAHAQVTNIDLTEAEKTEGYIGALLPWEVPDTFYNCSGNPPSPLLMKDEKVLTNHPSV